MDGLSMGLIGEETLFEMLKLTLLILLMKTQMMTTTTTTTTLHSWDKRIDLGRTGLRGMLVLPRVEHSVRERILRILGIVMI
jgi:hypothetical protein